MEDSKLLCEIGTLLDDTPVKVKDYVNNNLSDFLVPGNINETYNNICQFAEVVSYTYLKELFQYDNE